MKLMSKYPLLIIATFFINSGTANSAEYFRAPSIINYSSWHEAISIGDINNDGKNDVVATTSGVGDPYNDYKLYIYIQDKTGYIKEYNKIPLLIDAFSPADSVEAGDMNGDGLNDIVVLNNSKRIIIYYQQHDGNINLSPRIITANNIVNIKLADINGDGLLDIIGKKSNLFAVYHQREDMNIANAIFISADNCENIMVYDVKDLNDDNKNDLVYSCYSDNEYKFFIKTQAEDGTYPYVISYISPYGSNPIYAITTGDMNNDTLNDIVISSFTSQTQISIFNQEQDHTFNKMYTVDTYESPSNLQIIDVNNDNKNDLLVFHSGYNTAGIYIQEEGILLNEILIDAPYTNYGVDSFEAGDINNDGLIDIVASDSIFGFYALYNVNSVFNIQMPWLKLILKSHN